MHTLNSFQVLVVLATSLLVVIGAEKICLETSQHAPAPMQQKELNGVCKLYKNNTCCTPNTADRIDSNELTIYKKFICEDVSAECEKFFKKDACFYECSPDLGSWVQNGVPENVPLCQSDCEAWFDACSYALTCSSNWGSDDTKNFQCEDKNKCRTVKDTFKSASEFCSKVRKNLYKVTDQSECIQIDVRGADDICKNSQVAKTTKNSSPSVAYSIIIASVPFLMTFMSAMK